MSRNKAVPWGQAETSHIQHLERVMDKSPLPDDGEDAPYIGEDDVEEILSTIRHWYKQPADVSGDVYMARLYKIVHHLG